ncbi:hypothetical protein TAMA11512_13530 [Selenomonas sp. TAMA-11512]|uniref:hypothetical protein n=1 Tax=Selenomonas sp. TAMA-11512 TaxID=3095337 RepID=UPI0030903B72|nr:hypothetical protein TAMA11512_13530 [Selenomonas sp. TAMA-11512]
MEKLKKVRKLDWIVLAAIVAALAFTNYDSLSYLDYAFFVSIALWLFIFIGRTFYNLDSLDDIERLRRKKEDNE